MTDKINLAIVGATSLKGEAFLLKLSEMNFDLGEVFLLADETTAGEEVEFGKKELLVTLATEFDFAKVQYAIFLDDPSLTEQLYPSVEASGCIVIDASGYLGQRDDISLATLDEYQEPSRVMAIPEATTLQLWLTLRSLLQDTAVDNLNLTVLQCTAHAGKAGMEDLGRQTAQLLNFQDVQTGVFNQQLAFNLIPQVGELQEDGNTQNESVIEQQLSRLLVMSPSLINVTMLWTPVFFADTVSVSLNTQDSLDIETITENWNSDTSLTFNKALVPTPVTNVSGKGTVHLSRVRSSTTAVDTMRLTYTSMADPVQLTTAVCMQVLNAQLML